MYVRKCPWAVCLMLVRYGSYPSGTVHGLYDPMFVRYDPYLSGIVHGLYILCWSVMTHICQEWSMGCILLVSQYDPYQSEMVHGLCIPCWLGITHIWQELSMGCISLVGQELSMGYMSYVGQVFLMCLAPSMVCCVWPILVKYAPIIRPDILYL